MSISSPIQCVALFTFDRALALVWRCELNKLVFDTSKFRQMVAFSILTVLSLESGPEQAGFKTCCRGARGLTNTPVPLILVHSF